MKLAVKICKIVVIVVGAFFIILSLDVFTTVEGTVLELIGGFLINSIPGIVLILLVWLLWNKEWILGLILIVLGTLMTFFFGFFEEFPERLLTFFTIVFPLYVVAVIFLVDHYKTKAK